MKLIESKTLATAAASIEFTSIPQTYTDLVMLLSTRQSQTFGDGLGYPGLRINSGTTGYSQRMLNGDGSTASSLSYTTISYIFWYGANDALTTNTFGNTSIYFPNYTSAAAKSLSIDATFENNSTGARQSIIAGLSSSTSAITSLQFYALDSGLNNTPTFSVGTTLSLYGVLKGSDGIVTTS